LLYPIVPAHFVKFRGQNDQPLLVASQNPD